MTEDGDDLIHPAKWRETLFRNSRKVNKERYFIFQNPGQISDITSQIINLDNLLHHTILLYLHHLGRKPSITSPIQSSRLDLRTKMNLSPVWSRFKWNSLTVCVHLACWAAVVCWNISAANLTPQRASTFTLSLATSTLTFLLIHSVKLTPALSAPLRLQQLGVFSPTANIANWV